MLLELFLSEKPCVDLISYLAVTPFLCFLLQQNLERIVQILAVSNFSLQFCLKLTQINPVTSRLLNPLVGSSYSSYLTNQRHLTCSQPSFSTHFRNCPPWLPPASQSFSRSFFTHQPVQLQGPRAQSYILFPTRMFLSSSFSSIVFNSRLSNGSSSHSKSAGLKSAFV